MDGSEEPKRRSGDEKRGRRGGEGKKEHQMA